MALRGIAGQGKAKKSKAIAKAWLSYETSGYVMQRQCMVLCSKTNVYSLIYSFQEDKQYGKDNIKPAYRRYRSNYLYT